MDCREQTQRDNLMNRLFNGKHIYYVERFIYIIEDYNKFFWLLSTSNKINPMCFGLIRPTKDQIRKFSGK